MKGRHMEKGKAYIPVGETFTAIDGKRYKAVADGVAAFDCNCCDFGGGSILCGCYRCIAEAREDGVAVHFEACEE